MMQFNWRTTETGLRTPIKDYQLSKNELVLLSNQLKDNLVKPEKAKIIGYRLLYVLLCIIYYCRERICKID